MRQIIHGAGEGTGDRPAGSSKQRKQIVEGKEAHAYNSIAADSGH